MSAQRISRGINYWAIHQKIASMKLKGWEKLSVESLEERLSLPECEVHTHKETQSNLERRRCLKYMKQGTKVRNSLANKRSPEDFQPHSRFPVKIRETFVLLRSFLNSLFSFSFFNFLTKHSPLKLVESSFQILRSNNVGSECWIPTFGA